MGNGTIRNSTFVGNKTLGEEGDGGAIGYFGNNGSLVIENSTISGNSTSGLRSDGAGVFVAFSGSLDIRFSTISDNHVNHSSGVGGGISFRDPTSSSLSVNGGVLLRNSILANNTSAGINPDLYLRLDKLTSDYSLIEDTSGLTASQLALIAAGMGNITGQDPLLGALAENGGSTLTHDLLSGSPARDAGDPTFAPPPLSDQRSFARVSNGRADMGALEVQVPSRVGDWDGDGDVDGRDFLQWQRGGSPEPFSQTDLAGWQEEYGGELLVAGGELRESQELRVEGQEPERIAEVGLGIADWEGRAVSVSARSSPVTHVHGSPRTSATTRAGRPCYGESAALDGQYFEQVDRAVEQWNASTTLLGKPAVPPVRPAVAPFGELVTLRTLRRLRQGIST
jgi:hypothetical protein